MSILIEKLCRLISGQFGKEKPKEESDEMILLREIYTKTTEKKYEKFEAAIKDIKYTVSDIESIVNNALKVPPDYGLFVSALVNRIIQPEDVVTISPLCPMDYLGQELKQGKLIIEKNARENTGIRMEGGILEIKENVGKCAGQDMKGGKIIVHGCAAEKVGYGMSGGSIEIMLDAASEVGYCMRGGSIIVHGKAGNNVGESMLNGLIEIKSCAGDIIGKQMRNGKIIIGGKAGNEVGKQMGGGFIHLLSDAGDCLGENMTGGRIRVEGKAGKKAGLNFSGGIIELSGGYESIGEQISDKGEIHTS